MREARRPPLQSPLTKGTVTESVTLKSQYELYKIRAEAMSCLSEVELPRVRTSSN